VFRNANPELVFERPGQWSGSIFLESGVNEIVVRAETDSGETACAELKNPTGVPNCIGARAYRAIFVRPQGGGLRTAQEWDSDCANVIKRQRNARQLFVANLASTIFQTVDGSSYCGILADHDLPASQVRRKLNAQLLAVWLNIAHGRLPPVDMCIDLAGEPVQRRLSCNQSRLRALEVLWLLEEIAANPGSSSAALQDALGLAERINAGAAPSC
jgi:hypothetical protein